MIGLKPFSGTNHPELFGEDKNETEKITNKPNVKKTSNDDSDSDSDYEYFKVQKSLEKKPDETKTEAKSEGTEQEETSNVFVDALKTAIVEDELVLPATVNQTFLIVPMKLRLVTLCSLIVEHCVLNKKGGKMIVFMATLEMVDYLSELIETVLTGKDNKKTDSKKKGSQNGGKNDEVINVIKINN